MSMYPTLFQPVSIGPLTLSTRAIMGSMHTGLEDDHKYFDRLATYYVERVKGGAPLIVTGGFSPNGVGRLAPKAGKLTNDREVAAHRDVTNAVRAAGGHLALQILHAGRYALHRRGVAPSALRAPINPFRPGALSTTQVEKTIAQFGRCARLAVEAGYSAVEVMGSEGYLINQFASARTNRRADKWGGSFEARMRMALETVRTVRAELGDKAALIYRLSTAELVEDGLIADEVRAMAKAIEAAGADAINCGIGWHEAKIPTIATAVPRGAFAFAGALVKEVVSVPVIVSNRINDPAAAEQILSAGQADLVSMARPLLADPQLLNKARSGKAIAINSCIGCNQACLDWIFSGKLCSCLVNPKAGQETLWPTSKVGQAKTVAVVGAGPAGLAAATSAAERGHRVTLFEKSEQIGGQFNLAKQIPGKQEFYETLRYYSHQIEALSIELRLNAAPTDEELTHFDTVIAATGVTPHLPEIPGIDGANVVSYDALLRGEAQLGGRVVIIGGGGIALDSATFILEPENPTIAEYQEFWGIDPTLSTPGGLIEPINPAPLKDVTLIQRASGKIGKGLGKTTVWAHRAALKKRGLKTIVGVAFVRIDDEGVWINRDDTLTLVPADSVLICTGQRSHNPYPQAIAVGGAANASGLDANRAIREATEAAYAL